VRRSDDTILSADRLKASARRMAINGNYDSWIELFQIKRDQI
jgi:hypothetical protein